MSRLRHALGLAPLLALGTFAGAVSAQAGCAEDETFATLDFWVGDWDVLANGALVGHNRIEKVLGGCAVTERWTSAGGGEGHSLFYRVPGGGWRQVWVTANPRAPGGVKEKRLIETAPEGAVRFQGEIPLEGGGSYLDRTTLTPLPDRTVRQHIEISTDGGANWRTTFDAIYRRRSG